MTEEQWKEIIEDKCELMQEMLDNFTTEVKKMEGLQAFNYIQPMQDLLFEAAMDVLRIRNKRIEEGEQTLMSINPADE